MEFPNPKNYKDWQVWGRQLMTQLKRIPILERQQEYPRDMGAEGILYPGWASISVWMPATFWKDADDYVHFFGAVGKAGAPLNDPIFLLPEGYRPMHLLHKWSIATGFGIQINSTGVAIFTGGSSTAGYLGAITFKTSQYPGT